MLQPLLFFVVALLYACVGFGGGSSYVAFLALFDAPYEDIPQVALVCNIIVVSGGAYHFIRQRHFSGALFWPFALGSIPCAFVGGRIPIGKTAFLVLLGASLIIAGLRLLFIKRAATEEQPIHTPHVGVATGTGGLLGLLSGLVGIGGGIFLSPIMMNFRWGRPKQVAATASVFILVNSLAGLGGQIVKHAGVSGIVPYWPLFLAVFVGGQIGSRLGAGALSQQRVRQLTAVLVLIVGVRIMIKVFI
ncbi:MAG: sulfite exporter TauE/SafE family protein [Verrucomicrobia bacterium]|nr:sulfite exporter TauE/SafE family protein [Verrucomicrobiota bacterium]